MGFEMESSLPHPVWTIDAHGQEGWKKTKDLEVGDRIAIARSMEVWGNRDPLNGLSEHMQDWRKRFEGKLGTRPTELEIE